MDPDHIVEYKVEVENHSHGMITRARKRITR